MLSGFGSIYRYWKFKIKKWQYLDGGFCILTDDNKLYTVNEKENGNKQLIAESIIDLGENSRYDEDKGGYIWRVWVKNSQGTYYYIVDGKLSIRVMVKTIQETV